MSIPYLDRGAFRVARPALMPLRPEEPSLNRSNFSGCGTPKVAVCHKSLLPWLTG
jgi:hypothetical protein